MLSDWLKHFLSRNLELLSVYVAWQCKYVCSLAMQVCILCDVLSTAGWPVQYAMYLVYYLQGTMCWAPNRMA